MPLSPRRERGLTGRAILTGFLLCGINCFWIITQEERFHSDITIFPLLPTPVFFLLFLLVANWLMGWLLPGRQLRRGELLVIYIMLVLSSTVAAVEMTGQLLASMTHFQHFATPENQWQTQIWPLLPEKLLVWDPQAVANLYNGESSFWLPANFLPWLGPLARWGGFVLCLMLGLLCLNVLVRKPWMEADRLSFPLVELPLAATDASASPPLFRQGLLWAGAGLSSAIGMLHGLHSIFPTVPYLGLGARCLGQLAPGLFAASPWSSISFTVVSAPPFVIGAAFFAPLDLLFSGWFFLLAMKLSQVGGVALGYGSDVTAKFVGNLSLGAWLGIAAVLLWGVRRHLREIVLTAWGRGRFQDRNELLSYRAALVCLVGAGLFLLVFWGQAGLNPLLAALSMGGYFLMSLCIARARAEIGFVWGSSAFEPASLLSSFIGTASFSRRSLAGFSLMHWFWRYNRTNPMPHQLEALKICESARLEIRGLLWLMLAVVAFAFIFSTLGILGLAYHHGGETGLLGFPWWFAGGEMAQWLQGAIERPIEPGPLRNWLAAGTGLATVFVLQVLRTRCGGWPLHPLGPALAGLLNCLWFPLLVAWLVKFLLLRYGGIGAFRVARSFFLGLIIGQVGVAGVWALVGMLLGRNLYSLLY